MNPANLHALSRTAFAASEDREFFFGVLSTDAPRWNNGAWSATIARIEQQDQAIEQIQLCERSIINVAETLETLLTNEANAKGE